MSFTRLFNLQNKVIDDTSDEILTGMTRDALYTKTILGALYLESIYSSIKDDFYDISEMVKDIYIKPDRYADNELMMPIKENAGKNVLQIVYADEEARNDARTNAFVRKLVNLSIVMKRKVESRHLLQDCYIVLPNGTSMEMDRFSDLKLDENGNILPYDPRVRSWYKGALEKKDFYCEMAGRNYYLGVSEMAFGMPVYVDNELVAVIHGSADFDNFRRVLNIITNISSGDDSFAIFVDDDGMITLSSKKEGELALEEGLAKNINDFGKPELETLVHDVIKTKTGTGSVRIDGKKYITAYHHIDTPGWGVITFFAEDEANEPDEKLLSKVNENFHNTSKVIQTYLTVALIVAIFLIFISMYITFITSKLLSAKLSEPIRIMADHVSKMSREKFKFEMEDDYKTGDEIEILAETFCTLSKKMDGYIEDIVEFTKERERERAELEVAGRIQISMLPGKFPLFPDKKEFDLYALIEPAKQVGGDFYDAYLVDDDHLCMVMGDVSGKGIPAALFMTKTITEIRNYSKKGRKPSEILNYVNNVLCENNNEMMFVTVWLAILTISTGEIVESNAGHEKPAFKRSGESYQLSNEEHGIVLGAIKNQEYMDDSFIMNAKDVLFVYTDGLNEAKNTNDEMLGQDRMLKALNLADDDPQELIVSMKKSVNDFANGAQQFDDLTMLAIRYNGI
ncbi:SpoIIE family protein phosphatase [Butyrivibrio sp. WCE2006]|uniref:SpoIIE family protein phosphatase n=1 Tax=Butyrivibrio sp. WCE2006 TaxID=1410611 RepID=UPI0018CC5EF1